MGNDAAPARRGTGGPAERDHPAASSALQVAAEATCREAPLLSGRVRGERTKGPGWSEAPHLISCRRTAVDASCGWGLFPPRSLGRRCSGSGQQGSIDMLNITATKAPTPGQVPQEAGPAPANQGRLTAQDLYIGAVVTVGAAGWILAALALLSARTAR